MSGGVAYIGAGLDLSVLDIFKDENLFVLVDSNPRSPYGLLADHIKTSKAFIPCLENALKEFGFSRVSHKKSLYRKERRIFKPEYFHPGLLTYTDGKRTLHYFYSCCYPDKSEDLIRLLGQCDKLYVSGHEPMDNVLLHMKKPVLFAGSTTTCYTTEEPQGLFWQIKHNQNVGDLVDAFYYVEEPANKLVETDIDFFFGK
jgi:hypothetical protein